MTLDRPLTLPCGAVLRNRIVKAAMSDELGDGRGGATASQARLYERWARGGLAASIVGEMQIGPDHPENCGNLLLSPLPEKAVLRNLATRATGDGAHLWAQLGHAGALAVPVAGRVWAPSAIEAGGIRADAMSAEAVAALPARFAQAAATAIAAGFTGVEIHAGHGFLLSQFLSPLFNRRTDRWGGDAEGRSRIVLAIVAAIRAAIGPAVPIGLKINATDQLEGGVTESDFLRTLALLDGSTLDLVDISGGAYFPGAKAASEGAASEGAASDGAGKGPYFLEAAREARSVTGKPLMTVGGFKTRAQAVAAVESGAVDVVGLARALVLDPDLPARWVAGEDADPAFPRFAETIPGGITAWYTCRIAAIAGGGGNNGEADFGMSLEEAVERVESRRADNATRWRAAHGIDQDRQGDGGSHRAPRHG